MFKRRLPGDDVASIASESTRAMRPVQLPLGTLDEVMAPMKRGKSWKNMHIIVDRDDGDEEEDSRRTDCHVDMMQGDT